MTSWHGLGKQEWSSDSVFTFCFILCHCVLLEQAVGRTHNAQEQCDTSESHIYLFLTSKWYPELRDPKAWVILLCALMSKTWSVLTMSELCDTQMKRLKEGKLLLYNPSCSQYTLNCRAQSFSPHHHTHIISAACISPKTHAFLNFRILPHT